MTCRIERPDTRQHLTEFAEPTKETACVYGGVHTRQHLTEFAEPTKETACVYGGVHTRANGDVVRI